MTVPLAILAAPRRQAILRLVWDQERPAGDIHRALSDVTFGAVSQHLGALAREGLVDVRVEGRHRFYRARREALGPVAQVLEQMWDNALYQLQWRAELEAARRGPRAQARRRSRRSGGAT